MKVIPQRFLQDPQWYEVEEVIKEFIDPLLSILDINLEQDAYDMKAEIIGKRKAYEALEGFVRSRSITRSGNLVENKESIFK